MPGSQLKKIDLSKFAPTDEEFAKVLVFLSL